MQKERLVVVAAARPSFMVSLDTLAVPTALPMIGCDQFSAGVASSA
jgi:hypothetical protein